MPVLWEGCGWFGAYGATNGNFVLGNIYFQEEIEKMLGWRVTRGKAGRPSKVENKN